MSEKIKPALTAEEWEKFHVAEQVIWEVQIIGKDGVWEPDSHAIAALALYGQTFGVRYGMADAIDAALECSLSEPDKEWLRTAKSVILSLLPPRVDDAKVREVSDREGHQ